jgi:D-alanyl-lipoteichoic acid acyltransferase DltB (MBOAT superfamily)
VAFFPCLLAGPIDRPATLIPQLQNRRIFDFNLTVDGMRQILWGLFKKVVIADNCVVYVNEVFGGNYQLQSGATLLLAAVIFSFQMYADFSGYSDMAIGVAKLLGFRVTRNFDYPFFAQNIAEYWRKWHISLTSWLTDYVFTPLVWSRWVNKLVFGKKWQDRAPHFAANILIVFLISGLWHGASYNFLIWGALHGLFRLVEELLHKIRKPGKTKNKFVLALINPFKRLVVFMLATFAHIFFYFGDKSPSYVLDVIRKMVPPFAWAELWETMRSVVSVYVAGDANYINHIFYVLGGALVLVMLCDYFVIYRATKKRDNPCNVLQHLPFLLRWPCYLLIVAAIVAVGYFGTSEFVYFQF